MLGVLAPEVGMARACRVLGVARATAYRRRSPKLASPARPRRRPPLALSEPERTAVLGELHSERFADASPASVYATLLDEGLARMAAWVRQAGAGRSQRFEGIEIERNLPPSWAALAR